VKENTKLLNARFRISLFQISLLIIGTAIIFYLSWLPKPNIGTLPYFPGWLGKWIDANGNLRTAVPFVFLGAIMEMWFHKKMEFPQRPLFILSILIFIVSAAEIGQLFIPERHFDWIDIVWGTVGSVAGIVISAISLASMPKLFVNYNK